MERHRWNDGFLAKNGSEFQESTSSDVGEGPRRLAVRDGVHDNPESSNYVVRLGLMPFGNYARRRTRTDRGKTPTSAIPTGLRLPAEGCEATSYPGSQRTAHPTPTGLCHLCAAEPQPLWGSWNFRKALRLGRDLSVQELRGGLAARSNVEFVVDIVQVGAHRLY